MAVRHHDVGEDRVATIGDHTEIGDKGLIGRPNILALFSHRDTRAEHNELTREGEEEVVRNTSLHAVAIVDAADHCVIGQHGPSRHVVRQPLVTGKNKIGIGDNLERTKSRQNDIVGEEVGRDLISTEVMSDVKDVRDRERVFKVVNVQDSNRGSDFVTNVSAV